MPFTVSNEGVDVSDVKARFNYGKITVGGNFTNHSSGTVEIDVRADFNVTKDITNFGKFSIKDYLNLHELETLESAIDSINDNTAKELLKDSVGSKSGDKIEIRKTKFNKLISYLQEHPDLITDSIQIALQAISMFK